MELSEFDQFFRANYGPIHRFFSTKLFDKHEAEDLAQSTFVEFHRSVHRSDNPRQFLWGIARNLFLRWLRDKARCPHVDADAQSLSSLGVPSPELPGRSMEERLLLEGLRRLPINDQIRLELRYFERLSGKEIATLLNQNYHGTRRQLSESYTRLIEEIRQLEADPSAITSTLTTLSMWESSVKSVIESKLRNPAQD